MAVGSGPNPQVYGADLCGFGVRRFNADTSLSFIYGGVPAADAAFKGPYDIATDGSNTYVIDTNNQRVEAFDPATGAYQFKRGVRGFGATNPGFNWPRDLTIDTATNTVWVADTKNFRLSEFDRAGNPTGRTYGGTVGTGAGQSHSVWHRLLPGRHDRGGRHEQPGCSGSVRRRAVWCGRSGAWAPRRVSPCSPTWCTWRTRSTLEWSS